MLFPGLLRDWLYHSHLKMCSQCLINSWIKNLSIILVVIYLYIKEENLLIKNYPPLYQIIILTILKVGVCRKSK